LATAKQKLEKILLGIPPGEPWAVKSGILKSNVFFLEILISGG
jgi:hypothetical protein